MFGLFKDHLMTPDTHFVSGIPLRTSLPVSLISVLLLPDGAMW